MYVQEQSYQQIHVYYALIAKDNLSLSILNKQSNILKI